jgi:hypothetical protein
MKRLPYGIAKQKWLVDAHAGVRNHLEPFKSFKGRDETGYRWLLYSLVVMGSVPLSKYDATTLHTKHYMYIIYGVSPLRNRKIP